jgi:excisionase family DNA binding protein
MLGRLSSPNVTVYTTAELAAEMRVSKRKVTELATTHGIGANVGGSAGYRFREADVEALWEALRPVVAPPVRRRRRPRWPA